MKKGCIHEKPQANSNVWPDDVCPAFTKRHNADADIKECWYCRYADFHLKEERPLDVGVCNWPDKVL